jgi:hypothetical protein
LCCIASQRQTTSCRPEHLCYPSPLQSLSAPLHVPLCRFFQRSRRTTTLCTSRQYRMEASAGCSLSLRMQCTFSSLTLANQCGRGTSPTSLRLRMMISRTQTVGRSRPEEHKGEVVVVVVVVVLDQVEAEGEGEAVGEAVGDKLARGRLRPLRLRHRVYLQSAPQVTTLNPSVDTTAVCAESRSTLAAVMKLANSGCRRRRHSEKRSDSRQVVGRRSLCRAPYPSHNLKWGMMYSNDIISGPQSDGRGSSFGRN